MIKIFQFLGSINLAIPLIVTAALIVIAGTLIESQTDSHLLAASWTYEHPLFQVLLALFFINILVSALLRWPFQKKHIPFLITHLGLLMVIGGTMIKNQFGVQGNLTIWEGSGSHHLFLPHTHALYIEHGNLNESIPLDSFLPKQYLSSQFPNLTYKMIGYTPHAKEAVENHHNTLFYQVLPHDVVVKPEERTPGIILEFQEKEEQQTIALVYDGSAEGWKLPIFNGKYLVRFQPHFSTLPYHIRLRQARQISYPGTKQPYSYESDLLISNTPHTLSMNRVYETWEGYRFYLSGIGQEANQGIKKVQLAVNYDPAKYLLTYPGACLIFLGSALLFWLPNNRSVTKI